MSVSWGTQYSKLKTNLRLAANRLKLLQKKKTEQAFKARTEIAEFLMNDKEDRARIRVEAIIREDFIVEAYEILEMYCELLLARFGVIQQMKEIDDGIAEAVTSLLWVAPRIVHEISELKIISGQLEQKYGKQYAEASRMNQLPEPCRVSPKLLQKLSVGAPSKLLVEKYLIEIAKSSGVEFVPNAKVMRDDDDEIAAAERNLINFMNEDQIGWAVPQPPQQVPPVQPVLPHPNNPAPFAYPPPIPPYEVPSFPPPKPPVTTSQPETFVHPPVPPQLDSRNPNVPVTQPEHKKQSSDSSSSEHIYEVPCDDKDFEFDFPEPPKDDFDERKGNNGSGGGGSKAPPKDDLNFEDLAQRFQRLTKK